MNMLNNAFSQESQCDQVMTAILANHEQNPDLKDIRGLICAVPAHFSNSTEQIASLKAKGVHVERNPPGINAVKKKKKKAKVKKNDNVSQPPKDENKQGGVGSWRKLPKNAKLPRPECE